MWEGGGHGHKWLRNILPVLNNVNLPKLGAQSISYLSSAGSWLYLAHMSWLEYKNTWIIVADLTHREEIIQS